MRTVLKLGPRLRAMLRSSTPGRWWDASTALLLLAALFIAAGRLIVTGWTDHLDIVQVLMSLGAVTGLALGQSAFSSRQSLVFALFCGLYAVPWQLVLTLTYISDDALWGDRLLNLWVRLTNSIFQLMRQEPVKDPLLFVCVIACLSWVVGVHSGYTLTRHARAWRVILPIGAILLIIQNYDPFWPGRVWYLAAFLFFALLLVARVMYLHQYARWQREHIFLPTYVGTDLARVTLQITVLLILLAWATPAVSNAFFPAQSAWRDISRPWIALRNRLENGVAALRDQVSGVYTIYGDSLLLGRGDELTDDITLVIEVQPDVPAPPRYYWRARVYDYYDAGQWTTSVVSTTQRIAPDDFASELALPEEEPDASDEGRWTSTFTVTTAAPVSTLFIPARFLWSSRTARAELVPGPDGTVDIVALHANPPLRSGDAYSIRSAFNDATIIQLRSAGTDYPSGITDRYLQLPDDMSPRVQALAQEIAFDLDNPYDIVSAITIYLRTYISFADVIPESPPADQDPLEWFLFEVREGFCTYYASAEVAMLRYLGIPARVAVGYAEGERESGKDIYMITPSDTHTWPQDSELYVVRHRDAHAWPEVYFPGLGWVEFEPTASQPTLRRPLGEVLAERAGDSLSSFELEPDRRERWEAFMEDMNIPVEDSSSEPVADTSSAGPRRAVMVSSFGLGLGLILLVLIWRRRHPRDHIPFPVILQIGLGRLNLQPPAALARWAVYATLAPLARAYVEVNYALNRLNAPPDPADTPAERTAALSHLLPDAARPAQQLLTEYHNMTYSLRPGNLHVARQAGRDIRTLSWQAVIRKFFARLRS
ncbi:MAG: transglutaminase domain-containing protein [Chloroflexi bacterium]|nr:transglutaminase domain-containing protein [Chloroflexota bacterium]